jgi:uncharacterized protein (DUF488 family)
LKKQPLTIWTIGHSTRSAEDFQKLLEEQGIRALADVRRFPQSRRHPQFGQELFAEELGKVGVQYVHFPELGGRRPARPDSPNVAWRNEAFRGYADYMLTQEFQQGMARLLDLAAEKPTAVMCAEAVWWQCHRSLISDWLKARGHRVLHIMAAGKVQEHPYTSAASILEGKLSYAGNQEELFAAKEKPGVVSSRKKKSGERKPKVTTS